jgi:hypothetical protein
LNVEHNKVETPYQPVIRLGSPVFTKNGIKIGVIILNVNAHLFLNRLKSLTESKLNGLWLLNMHGYWLSSDRVEQEWGFMFEDMKHVNMQKQYPEIWKEVTRIDRKYGSDKIKDMIFSHAFSTHKNRIKYVSLKVLESPEHWIIVSF